MTTRNELQNRFRHQVDETGTYSLTGQELLDDASLAALNQMVNRMENNYPYAHPLYAGQMLKPPHAIAREAYAYAQNINPNNHALDGGKESSAMEIEAVAQIAAMFGFESHLGHLTGGGTMANMEALWVAGNIHPNKRILASKAAHYTHERITAVLKIPFDTIALAADKPIMDLSALELELKKGDVGTVVVTAGTTGTGHIEPVEDVISLCSNYGVRVHVDAAYGGYFSLLQEIENHRHFAAIKNADSVVLDPHKHGLQPYGCGCILFADPKVGKYYLHESPYTYFTSDQLHLGEISLECSRPGAAAVALWTTMMRFPLIEDGEMAEGLRNCHLAAQSLFSGLSTIGTWMLPYSPQTDIVVYAPKGNIASEISKWSERIFDEAERRGLYLAMYKVPAAQWKYAFPDVEVDIPYVTTLRSTLMKWNHIDYIDQIIDILEESRKSTEI